jgi:hypothetical protein
MNTWEIDSITSVPKFLASIAQYLPAAHTVSFEIQAACSEARRIYAKHQSQAKYRPSRDTISPRTELHYCIVSPALAEDLEALLRRHDLKEVFWHVKGFNDRKLLFAIHDADLGDSACLSSHIDSKLVHAISSALGRTPTKIQTKYDWDEDHGRKKGR